MSDHLLYAVVQLKSDGTVPLSSKSFIAGRARTTLLDASYELADRAVGYGIGDIMEKTYRDRLRVVAFRREGRKDAKPIVVEQFAPIAGMTPSEIFALRAELLRQLYDRNHASKARALAYVSRLEGERKKPPEKQASDG